MVKLEEVLDEEFNKEQPVDAGAEDEWDTDDGNCLPFRTPCSFPMPPGSQVVIAAKRFDADPTFQQTPTSTPKTTTPMSRTKP